MTNIQNTLSGKETFFSSKHNYEENRATFSKEKPRAPGSPQGDPDRFVIRQIALLRSSELYNREGCFDILSRTFKLYTEGSEGILDWQTCIDLNLLRGSHSNPTEYLGGRLCETVHTEMGKTYLLSSLVHPTINRNALQARKAIIRFLGENEGVYTDLETHLGIMGEQNEAELLSFWGDGMRLPGCLAGLYAKDFGS